MEKSFHLKDKDYQTGIKNKTQLHTNCKIYTLNITVHNAR